MADDRDIRAEHRDESTLFVMHHTHWDREWYQSFPELQVRLRDALRHVSALLRDGRIDNFFLDGQTCVGRRISLSRRSHGEKSADRYGYRKTIRQLLRYGVFTGYIRARRFDTYAAE